MLFRDPINFLFSLSGSQIPASYLKTGPIGAFWAINQFFNLDIGVGRSSWSVVSLHMVPFRSDLDRVPEPFSSFIPNER